MASPLVKVSALIIAAQIIALATLPTGAVRSGAAATLTFQASVDFSNEQGYHGWSYRDSTGALLTYDGAHQRWYGSEAYLELWRNGGHPGATRGAMRRWTAPQSGSIRVTGTVRDGDAVRDGDGRGDGVEFVIRKNGSILWQQALANGNITGVSFDLALSVAQNDALDFIVNRGPATNSWDSTYYDPVITYGTVTSSTSTSTSGTSGSSVPPAPTGLYQRLLGPVAALSQWTDSIEQSAAAILANKPTQYLLTEPANTNASYEWLGPNYYDRTAWCYRYATASGRGDILGRCRFYAREVSTNPMMANFECLARTGDYVTCSPRPANRDNHPLGLALAATDSRDPTTQDIAKNGLARSAYGGFRNVSNGPLHDPREYGNGFLAVVLSHAVGAGATPLRWGVSWDSAERAAFMLQAVLAAQQSWGCWNTVYADPATGIVHTPVYMQGLVLAGLQAYADYVENDPRVVPAVQRCVAWLQAKYRPGPNPSNSDNRLGLGGWIYSYRTDGQTGYNGNVYPSLSGTLIGPIGWLWMRTGDARWHTLADAAFVALVREAGPGGTGVNDSKEANQWARPIVNWASSR